MEEIELDFLEVCRLCLGRCSYAVSLCDPIENIPSKLESFLKVAIGDGLPQQVCQPCLRRVNICHSFILKWKEADDTLRQLCMSAQIKEKMKSKTAKDECIIEDRQVENLFCTDSDSNDDDEDDDDDVVIELEPEDPLAYVKTTDQPKQEYEITPLETEMGVYQFQAMVTDEHFTEDEDDDCGSIIVIHDNEGLELSELTMKRSEERAVETEEKTPINEREEIIQNEDIKIADYSSLGKWSEENTAVLKSEETAIETKEKTPINEREKIIQSKDIKIADNSSLGKWSKEQTKMLKYAVRKHDLHWDIIATYFPRMTPLDCENYWKKIVGPEMIKGAWSKQEDEILIRLVQRFGPKRWAVISKHLHGRRGKQCRERWMNHLRPDVKKENWTKKEDQIIIRAQAKYGNRWAKICKLLPGRTDNSVKNRWNSKLLQRAKNDDANLTENEKASDDFWENIDEHILDTSSKDIHSSPPHITECSTDKTEIKEEKEVEMIVMCIK